MRGRLLLSYMTLLLINGKSCYNRLLCQRLFVSSVLVNTI